LSDALLSATRMHVPLVVRPGLIEWRDMPVPTPGPGELLLRIDAALTCGTELKLLRRGHARIPFPVPLGHEFCGTVAAVGVGVREWRPGDAVACVPTSPCGACAACAAGRENLCPDAVGRMVFGAFGGWVVLPEPVVALHVFRRPPHMPPEEAAGLEPLACVVHGARRARLAEARSVEIIGDGAIALLFAQLARHVGVAEVRVVGRHEARLAIARGFGAEAVTSGSGPDRSGGDRADRPDRAHRPNRAGRADRPPSGCADLVIECVGTPETWAEALGRVAPGGTLLAFGGCPPGAIAPLDAGRIHYEEVDVIGAFHYTTADVREAWALLQAGAIRMAPLLTARLPMSRAEEALGLVADRRAVKVALLPDAASTPLAGAGAATTPGRA
jgi:L-iditol 2-dehydrogenase